ncbi:MAG: HlyC/CorC family transporter [Candidatus Cloacimonetes bacterium]|nr:HlyC/CorC family transporter [Candidatus Cloacimonadota bacterium]
MILNIILLIFLLILSAFFSSSETALFSLSRMYRKKLENSPNLRKRYITKLLKHPQQLLITILLGNTVVNVAFASLSVILALDISKNFHLISESIVILIEIVIVTVIILIFGEIIPKVYAIQYAEKYSSLIAFPIGFFRIILFPIIKVLEWIVYIFTPGKKSNLVEAELKVTTEDIKNIVYDSSPDVVEIQKDEREMLNSAFEFSDTRVKEVMTPRVDITAIDIEDGIEKLINTIKESGFSRIPIFRGNVDNIIGMVYSKDIILNREGKKGIKNLMRSCNFIPENMKISYLLSYFQKNRIHLAIVVDEYGGTSGIVTLEDVLEEIVGEILDETDVKKIEIKKISKDEYMLDGSTDIDELNKRFGLEIDDSFDSFSGFLYHLFGKIPDQKETIIFKEKFKFSIEKLDGQRISSVKMIISEGSA